MNVLRTVALVTLRELRERGLSKSYLISWVVLLVLVAAGFTIPRLLDSGDEPLTYRIGTVGTDSEETVTEAASMVVGAEPPVLFETESLPGRDAAVRAVSNEEVDAALVHGRELVVGESTEAEVRSLLREAAAAHRIRELIAAGDTSEEVMGLLTEGPLYVTEAVPEAGEDVRDRQFVIGQAALVLLFMAIMMTGSWVLLGVTEEKTSRVVEVLLATIRPWNLLAGKIVGVGILGLLQFAVLISGILLGVRLLFGADLIPEVDGALLATLLVWFVLGYAVYAVGYAAVGAIAARPEDAQNAAFPMTLVSLIGYLVGIFYVGGHPDSILSVILSLVPLTAPFVIPVRAVSDSISLWEQLAAAGLMIAFTAWLVGAAGRVYAGGVFKHRSRVKMREAFRSADF